jgi:hypothetical protein
MISRRAMVAVAVVATASPLAVYYGLPKRAHSPSPSSYVVVDTRGQRIAGLFDSSRPPSAEQVAFFKKYPPHFGKIRSGACPQNAGAAQPWLARVTTRLSSLVNTTVHAQGSCVPSYFMESYCPDCASEVCAGNGPGCAQYVDGNCLCYYVTSCNPYM